MCEKLSPSNEELALKYAIEMRKFEIELYWKRTSYFWALNTVILSGIGYTIKQKHHEAAIILSCIAVVLSFAWIFVNKGSKFWQENWEIQVTKREKSIIGPLFSGVFYNKLPYWQQIPLNPLTRPFSMSVSRINLLVCWFIFFICMTSLAYSWGAFWKNADDYWFCSGFTVMSSLFCLAIACSRSHIKKNEYDKDISQTPEQILAAAQAERDARLAATDWYAVRASEPGGKPIPQEILAYRAALRTIDQQPGWPTNPDWPELPVSPAS